MILGPTAVLAYGLLQIDVFSPGPLAKGHAGLEGLAHCKSCHESGKEVAADRCLSCHKELGARVAKGAGFHGRLSPDERKCEKCHTDHQGRDHALVDWGGGGKKAFSHTRAGWPLRGKHSALDCGQCHAARAIRDDAIRKLASKAGVETYLGLGTHCTDCHFDEHRGQVGTDCQRCHDERAWKPAKFDHAKTDYPLTGSHQQVACAKCHAPAEDTSTPADAYPTPRSRTFARWKGVAHAQCSDCHKDPHAGRFGADCQRCHTTAAWTTIVQGGMKAEFHDTTRFPLRGQHRGVKCTACHGPFPGQPARFKGVPFAACTDCHIDAHLGQIAGANGKPAPCERCHAVEGFLPARFEIEDHEKTRYPLAGAHRTVACGACHAKDEKLRDRLPKTVPKRLAAQRRPENLSLARFDFTQPTDRCETCHRDVHRGQFEKHACTSCHRPTSFADLAFDHARDSRFPLLGAHARAGCAQCHRQEKQRGETFARYRPVDRDCASCHADVHRGQFASRAGERTDCARCHGESKFTDLRFSHKPPFTPFVLDGKHERVPCSGCHRPVEVAPGRSVVRYRPLPRTCASCHADVHKGAFDRFVR
jgi:hypothetical protein